MAGSPADRRRRATAAAVPVALALLALGAAGCSEGDDSAERTPRASVMATTTVAAGDGDGAPRASQGCGTGTARSVSPDLTTSAVEHDGLMRTHFQQVPEVYDGATPVPVVLDMHGALEGAELHVRLSELAADAAAEGYLVVLPSGTGPTALWNTFDHPEPDDVGYLLALLDDLAATLCIDESRVYATGLSLGGYMAARLACEAPQRFAAIATVGGLQYPEAACEDTAAVPVLAIHGTDDEVIAYGGDPEFGVATIPQAAASWARHNGCRPEPVREELAADVLDDRWEGCDAAAEVRLLTVQGGGHTWPGSALSVQLVDLLGHTTSSLRANDLLIDFFSEHRAG